MDKLNSKLPDMAPSGPLDQNKGLLSILGDPLGQVLDKGLKPLGTVTGGIGNPTGDALKRVQLVAKHEKAYTEEDNDLTDAQRPGGESIGGKEQNDKNPLGL